MTVKEEPYDPVRSSLGYLTDSDQQGSGVRTKHQYLLGQMVLDTSQKHAGISFQDQASENWVRSRLGFSETPAEV